MKKILLLSLLFLFLTPLSLGARDVVSDWYFKDYQVKMTINQDSSLDVEERILADIANVPDRYGIYRVIPLNFKGDGFNFKTPVDNIVVTDFDGNNVNFTQKKQGQTILLDIYTKGQTVSGENEYLISYTVKNAIRFENPNFAEFYWNILGHYWELEIDNFSATIVFPEGFDFAKEELYVYSGLMGVKSNDIFTFNWLDERSLFLESTRTLKEREGLTISATIPKDLLNEYVLSFEEKYGYTAFELIIYSFLSFLLVLIVFYVLYTYWLRYGKEKKIKKPIIAEFTAPENLSPIEMGMIKSKGVFNNKFLTATLISLLVKSYLQIKEDKKRWPLKSKYSFIRTDKEYGDDLYLAEKYILNTFFVKQTELSLSILAVKLGADKNIKNMVLDDLDRRLIINKKSINISTYLFIISALLFFAMFFFIAISVILLILSIVLLIITIIFAFLMLSRREKGAELNWRIKCFVLYLKTAEKYRSQFNEREGIMEEFLPYAVLFNMTKKWLNKMKSMYKESGKQIMYSSMIIGSSSVNDIDSFVSSMESISKEISSSVSPSSSGSSGSGSSGGGGGGGGGGGR